MNNRLLNISLYNPDATTQPVFLNLQFHERGGAGYAQFVYSEMELRQKVKLAGGMWNNKNKIMVAKLQ
jgi:hypothetical protein